MKRVSVIFVVMFAVLALALPVYAAEQTEHLVFRFAGQQIPEHLATKTMEQIAEEVKEKTNGRIEIKVYPADQLGNYSLVFEEMMRGTIDMSMESVATDFDPRLEIVYANGYLRSYEDAKKIFDPDGWFQKAVNSVIEPLGVHLLGSYIEGMISIASTKPVIDPLNPNVDKGILCRTPNMASYELGAKAMGIRPITIPWSDVYQSMQTGVCDACDGMAVTAAYTILGDVMKYWYHTMYSMEYLGLMISDKSWKKLTPEEQDLFREIGKKLTYKSVDQCQVEDEKYMKKMEEKGIKVFRYTPEELAPLMKACQSTWKELGKHGHCEDFFEQFRVEVEKAWNVVDSEKKK